MLSFHIKFVHTDRRMERRTDGKTNGQSETDGQQWNNMPPPPRSFDTGAQKYLSE